MTEKKKIRVRFAPSPTGYFHIGSAQAALFNYRFARKQGGSFVLRIEDTDLERSKEEYEAKIFEALQWLGLGYDEGPNIEEAQFGPYRQSERIGIYQEYIQKLLDENRAYYCFASKEELEEMRQAAMTQGLPPIYNGLYRNLPQEEALARVEKGDPYVIRFKVGPGKVRFKDLIRGEIEVDTNTIGDFVIAKKNLAPLFLLSNAIDDSLMEISHVIRGEDHISNTPKQILLQEAFGFKKPHYAHFPLILNPDRSKMSKRFGAVTVEEYRDMGYLPEAMFNFLCLLGWHPQDNREIMTQEELIEEFDLERVQKGGAIFEKEKLNWMNNHYIRQRPAQELLSIIKELYLDKELDLLKMRSVKELSEKQWLKIVELSKERMNMLSEFLDMNRFFLGAEEYEAEKLVWKKSDLNTTRDNLSFIQGKIEALDENTFESAQKLEEALMPFAEERGRGEVLWPLRVALSGKDASPGPFDIMAVLGKHESLLRIDTALTKLQEHVS
ncbi:MAG: glutamate--tRNA ligase [Candidatus Harrisonbacteria bacterium]|nr:glutamate--tRNA ligase [Candidatus Harrisonbacteria bacterium]